MIIEEYDESLFIQRFENMNRVYTEENKNGNFTYTGLRFLFEYLDELYDKETPYKMDVIGLCCQYSEYKDLKEFVTDYYSKEQLIEKLEEYTGKTDLESLNEEEYNEFKECMENELNDNTALIKFDDDLDEGFILENY